MGESYYAACQSAQEQDMIEAKAVAPFLKDGEQPSECIKRWRADALAVLELLTQEKVKSETLAAEVAKLLAACAAKDAALRMLDTYMAQKGHAPLDGELIRAALSTDAGRNWIDATGAVEGKVAQGHLSTRQVWTAKDALPDDWAGRTVLVMVKP